MSEVLPDVGARAVARMRATGTPEQDVDILADLFAEDLAEWPDDLWLVFDDYQFAMEAKAPERFVDGLLRRSPIKLLLTSRKRPRWASARRLLYGEIYELGRNDLAMDHDEAAAVLAHRKDAPAAGLVALAEGWPAVIGLAALTDDLDLPEGSLPDTLYEYFAEELYQAASPAAQKGLCRLALAPSLGEGLPEFLLGEDARDVIDVGVRLRFLAARSGGHLELHPLLRAFLDTKTREHPARTEREAKRLALYFADRGAWDDAYTLVELFFSERLFLDILELGLPSMLAEARTASLARWVSLGELRKADAPVVDLAEAEIAFHEGNRTKSRSLAIRAARGFGSDHFLVSRAHYIAGTSARLDFHNTEARGHYAQALETASTTQDRRNAIYGDLIVSLDLNSSDANQRLTELLETEDGTAASDVRIALGRLLVGIRTGQLDGIAELMESSDHLVARLTEPHLVSSFYFCHAFITALQGRYAEAYALARKCEQYAIDVRLPFVLPHAQVVRAMADLGLRYFARCSRLLDRVDRSTIASKDIFNQVEARLVRARLLIAQGLAPRAIESLADPPRRFPFAGEHGEYLATLGLAKACAMDHSGALQLARAAGKAAQTVEVQSLTACTGAIVALNAGADDVKTQIGRAAEIITSRGGIDSFVTAYRGCPRLLGALAEVDDCRETLITITEQARDWSLAESTGLTAGHRKEREAISRREKEVLNLITQGLTNKEIAQTLFISEATAKVHVQNIFRKLGVKTRAQAAVRAAEAEESGT
jgi:DNA-binding CsgD family transcriptional regulator